MQLLEWRGFEWDEQKDIRNRFKHKLGFDAVRHVFFGPVLVREDARRDYGEVRYRAIGRLQEATVVVVFTEREEGVCRLISARRANHHEREAYRLAREEWPGS